MGEEEAKTIYHLFVAAAYFFPLLGSLISDEQMVDRLADAAVFDGVPDIVDGDASVMDGPRPAPGPGRDADVHRRELHPVHGLHHRLRR